MRDLYHGTVYDITEIDVNQGRGYKDFGKGFYATSVKSHAENMARRNKRIIEAKESRLRQRNPNYRTGIYYAYRYDLEFDDSCLEHPGNLNVKIFTEADREWLCFILKNRESEKSVHNYDIVIGPTADENTVTIINSYREELTASGYGKEVLDALIKELKPENLPKQYFLVRMLPFKSCVLRETEGRL